MSNILVLGAGFVAGPLVDYLAKKPTNQLTIASQFIEESQRLVNGRENVHATTVDVTNSQALDQLIRASDIVVSLVPYQFHVDIAKIALANHKHVVTASYESEEMRALDGEAKEKGITLLNEIGLDPGIDHLSAMKIIDEVKSEGAKVESFVSWCGGLPAQRFNNNPLGYKFAWAPKGVLQALNNDATFLRDGKVVTTPQEKLLSQVASLNVSNSLSLEGYPNRNSVHYQQVYQIEGIKDLVRGTLRYPGFSQIMRALKSFNFLSNELVGATSWRKMIAEVAKVNHNDVETQLQLSEEVIQAMNWLGLLSDEETLSPGQTRLDALCELLQEKLKYLGNETDMVALIHKFVIRNADNSVACYKSSLVMDGDVGGYSAMSKTVGIPAAIATQLLLDGKITQRGSIIPVSKQIYSQILPELQKQGIDCREEKVEMAPEVFIAELSQL